MLLIYSVGLFSLEADSQQWCFVFQWDYKNKMLIKKNLPISRTNHSYRINNLLSLRQQEQYFQQETTLAHFPSHTLNPQNPISSVLISEKPSNPVFNADQSDSEFSFKQRVVLSEEIPQHLQEVTIKHQQIPTIKAPIVEVPKVVIKPIEQLKIGRGKKNIGMLVSHRQNTNSSYSQASESAETVIRKPISLSLGCSRLDEVLNKIKSLKIGPEEEHGKQSQRYITKNDESKLESTNTSGQESSPIKKSVLSSIRKHVERMNLSLAKDHKIRQEEQDSGDYSLLFNNAPASEGKNRITQQELLHSKNKSFLVRSTNKKLKRQPQTVIISYKTSILELKELCAGHDQSVKLKITIPQPFSRPLFEPEDLQEDMFTRAVRVLRDLGVASVQPMTIRKYSNCAIVIVEDLAIVSYFSGHIYFGGWQDGNKQGLGLEWFPKKYAYYGQYANNKREGYGVLKDYTGQVFLGEWKDNKLTDRSRKNGQF